MVAFVGSVETAEELQKHMPALYIYDTWKPKVLEDIYNDQEVQRRIKGPEQMPLIGIFLDDMSYLKKKVFESEIMRKCACACRHANLIIFCSTQYCKDIPVYMRDNTKLTSMCANKNPQMREKIYEAYNPGFLHFKDFDRTFRELTEKKHEVMVCTGAGQQSYDISKSVFFYKAPSPAREYKINPDGAWWRVSQKKYDNEYFLRHLSSAKRERIKEEALAKAQKEKKERSLPGCLTIKKHYRPPTQFYFYRR